jgi:hypothetical protein
MAKAHHTWLFEPGRWQATGLFWEGGRTERRGRGTSIVRHERDAWTIAGEMEITGDAPARFENNYRIAPPDDAATVLAWESENPAVGRFRGVFAVAGDSILSFFQTPDGRHAGSECLTRLAPNRYQARGIFTTSGGVVSTWSMELVREA